MDRWVIGLIALCVVGLAAITYGALHDRRLNRRRVAEMLSAPAREIPRFAPSTPAPQYLSELMARRAPDHPDGAPSADERRDLDRRLVETDPIMVGFASADFVTDAATKRAVLAQPRVLVCAEPPGSIRELITVLEKIALAGTPLVIAAPSLPADVLGTLEVNRIQRRMAVLAVTSADPAVIDAVAAVTGAHLVSRIDLQASYVTDAHLGRCGLWVSDQRRSWVLG